jgi:hypothetical protein
MGGRGHSPADIYAQENQIEKNDNIVQMKYRKEKMHEIPV